MYNSNISLENRPHHENYRRTLVTGRLANKKPQTIKRQLGLRMHICDLHDAFMSEFCFFAHPDNYLLTRNFYSLSLEV